MVAPAKAPRGSPGNRRRGGQSVFAFCNGGFRGRYRGIAGGGRVGWAWAIRVGKMAGACGATARTIEHGRTVAYLVQVVKSTEKRNDAHDDHEHGQEPQ